MDSPPKPSEGVSVPPRRAEGARLLLSAREVVEESTAESGFVGFLSAAVEGVG